MESDKTVSFVWQKWMAYGTAAIIFFIISYVMAVTMPMCTDCKAGEGSAIQLFHVMCMILFLVGSLITIIAAFCTWNDRTW
jgi:hypothetical protein